MRHRLLTAAVLTGLSLLVIPGATVSAASPAEPGDFNGDGIIDLAIGVPGDTLNGHKRAGSVAVTLGRQGTTPGSAKLVYQGLSGVPGGPEKDDGFSEVLASGDFNGDGYADLVVGTPQEDLGTAREAGGVTVLYGSASGIQTTGARAITKSSAQIPGSPQPDDYGALSLATGDINGDGYPDLAMGYPLEDTGGKNNAGSVKVVFGGGNDLLSHGVIDLTQDTPGVPGDLKAGNRFGASLAIGDINGDGQKDLIVGTAGQQAAGSSDRGALHVLFGPLKSDSIRGQAVNAADVSQAGEFLGSTMAVGDFDNDGHDDVAVGMAEQLVNGDGAAGQIAVFSGDRSGLSARRVRLLHQDTSSVAGGTEPEDMFANAVAAGDFDGDGRDDLIVGVRGEDISSATAAGTAQVFFGHPTYILANAGSIWIDQSVGGAPTLNHHFGWTVGAADIDGDGKAEALIGAPGNGAGAVHIVHLDERTIASSATITQQSLGLGAGQTEDFFGQSLSR